MSKTQLISDLAQKTNLAKGQVSDILEALASLATQTLKTEGEFTIPGLVKITSKEKPATAERQGLNPFTKQPIVIPAKPASKKLAAKPIAALKKAIL